MENKKLKIIFECILPALDKGNIDYRVSGGIASATLKKEFYRYNQDVDLVVSELNFDEAGKILRELCRSDSHWSLIYSCLDKRHNSRPKYELEIKENSGRREERLSLIPWYVESGQRYIVFPSAEKRLFSESEFSCETRRVGDYTIKTFPVRTLGQLYIMHIKKLLRDSDAVGGIRAKIDDDRKYKSVFAKYVMDYDVLFSSGMQDLYKKEDIDWLREAIGKIKDGLNETQIQS